MRPAQDQQCHEEPHPESRRNCKVPLRKDKKKKKTNKEKKSQQGEKTKIQWNLTSETSESRRNCKVFFHENLSLQHTRDKKTKKEKDKKEKDKKTKKYQ